MTNIVRKRLRNSSRATTNQYRAMEQQENQGTQGGMPRPRYLPPLSLSPFLRRRRSFLNQNSGEEEAAIATKTKKMNSKPNGNLPRRRNAICDMMMPTEYFAALPHLELLNVRYQFSLVGSASRFPKNDMWENEFNEPKVL